MMQVSYQIELLCILFATNQEHYNQRIHGRTKNNASFVRHKNIYAGWLLKMYTFCPFVHALFFSCVIRTQIRKLELYINYKVKYTSMN